MAERPYRSEPDRFFRRRRIAPESTFSIRQIADLMLKTRILASRTPGFPIERSANMRARVSIRNLNQEESAASLEKSNHKRAVKIKRVDQAGRRVLAGFRMMRYARAGLPTCFCPASWKVCER